ncbi:MAG: nucleotidyltransferase domain-containing protein [Candidatus Woesearchaeota archaeon]|nr:nucleotidyltransferase domain-containing protein [Candidatus Woesearchaeota archaeon]
MNDLVSYAYDFISYLSLQPFFRKYALNKIILFGSVARGDFTKKSDIDIFIDVLSTNKIDLFTREIEKTKTSFFESERMKKWNRLNISNNFNVVVGSLKDEKWSDLRKSMQTHAMSLWSGFFIMEKKGLKSYALVRWVTGAKNTNKRVSIARKLYGYKQKGKKYTGLLEETSSKTVGKGVALIPIEHVNRLRKLFDGLEVKYSLMDVFIT